MIESGTERKMDGTSGDVREKVKSETGGPTGMGEKEEGIE